MSGLSRRDWYRRAAAALAASVVSSARRGRGASLPGAGPCTLSFGTYGMAGMPLEQSIRVVAETGFEGIEIAVQPGYDATPGELSEPRRQELRRQLDGSGLTLSALMEHLEPAEGDGQHASDCDRLRRVTELARDLAPDRPPLVQTVLGGGTWEARKGLFRDRLGDWLSVFREAEIVLAIKPHRGGAMSEPGEAIWLIEELGTPRWLRMVYDYSHYAFRDMSVEQTVRLALPYTAYVVAKDAALRGDRVVFLLPGESGTFDHAGVLKSFHQGGYRGDVCCEVSGMVSKAPGYDPIEAAKISYRNMAAAFDRAGVPRPRDGGPPDGP